MPLILALVFGSFVISASVGLGGSLLMVPTLVLAVGTKEGVALAALLLGANNIVKVLTYRKTLPFRAACVVIGCTIVGSALGSQLLVRASPLLVGIAVAVASIATLLIERVDFQAGRRAAGPALAFTSGATSGFSGTSGPLKGIAIRNLGLDRLHFVGAASLTSLAGDATKVAVFRDAELLGGHSFLLALLAVPLMAAGTALGRRIATRVTETGFAVLFWGVMTGYGVRLAFTVL